MNEPRTAATFNRDLSTFVRAAAGLLLIGASLGLAIAQLRNRDLAAFIADNSIPKSGRRLLLVTMGAGGAVGLMTTLLVYLPWRNRDGLRRLSRAVRLLAPLGLAAFLPGFWRGDAWRDPLKLTIAMGAFVLGQEPLWRMHFGAYVAAAGRHSTQGIREPARSFAPPLSGGWSRWVGWAGGRFLAGARRLRTSLRKGMRTGNRKIMRLLAAGVPAPVRRNVGPAVVVAAMAVFYIAYMSFYVVRNHHRFNSFTWDLGQIDNQFYNFLHGHPFRCTALIREGNWSELRNHVEATMFFLLPIYAIWPAAETLLVLQAVLLGAAGVCVYRFAARRVPKSAAVALTAAYYLYPPMHGAQFFDIHFQPVAAAFLLAAIDCFDIRRMRLFVVFFVLGICCREDISVGTAVFGLFLVLTGHRARAGLVIMIVSVAYFVALRFFIMPAFGQWGFAEHYRGLFPENERTFGGVLKTMIGNPVFTFSTLLTADKLRYALQILVPLAFLPLRRIHLAMSILPGALFTFLTTDNPPSVSIAYQYSAYFLPYFFPAAALALAALARDQPQSAAIARQRAAVVTMLVATLVATTQWGAIPPRREFHSAFSVVKFEPPTRDHIQFRKGLHELERMVPRDAILAVTDREMPHVSNRLECWNFSAGFQGADFVIYTEDHPIPSEREMLDAALRAGYTRVATRPGLVLLKKPGAP